MTRGARIMLHPKESPSQDLVNEARIVHQTARITQAASYIMMHASQSS
jgi:hypothetical protein